MKGSHLGEFELTVMLVLTAIGEAASGRRVYEEIIAQTGRDAAVAAVHVTLARLEEKGLLELSLAPEGNGGRAVRHFAVTTEGERALTQARDYWDRLWAGSPARPERSR